MHICYVPDQNSHSDTNSNKQCKQGYTIYGIRYVQWWLFDIVCMLLKSSKKHVLSTRNNCQPLYCFAGLVYPMAMHGFVFLEKKEKEKEKS